LHVAFQSWQLGLEMKPSRLLAFAALACASAAQAQDVPGSKDFTGFKRYAGSRIVHYSASNYADYKLDRDGEWGKSETVEGAVTRIVYLVPQTPAPLEVFRNYEQMLADAGYQQTFELKSDAFTASPDYFFVRFFEDAEVRNPSNLDAYGQCGVGTTPEYATYKSSSNGQDATVALFVSGSNGCKWGAPDFKTPIAVAKGQVVVGLDMVVSKGVENKMVVVKAADIADALATKGVVDLYGVYFDTDKTDVKPESMATLDEIASLLKIDRSLKLEISGHTDNTGTRDHNMKLSQGRAQAVVGVLVAKYGIDPKRLIAKGYGDTKPVAPNDNDVDKAKNRRVELRKI